LTAPDCWILLVTIMNELQIINWVKVNKKSLVDKIVGRAQPSDTPAAIIMAGVPGTGMEDYQGATNFNRSANRARGFCTYLSQRSAERPKRYKNFSQQSEFLR
jgi:hypothetical protein